MQLEVETLEMVGDFGGLRVTFNAATSVKTNDTITTVVAIARVSENIFFS